MHEAVDSSARTPREPGVAPCGEEYDASKLAAATCGALSERDATAASRLRHARSTQVDPPVDSLAHDPSNGGAHRIVFKRTPTREVDHDSICLVRFVVLSHCGVLGT